jgi:hypothetical protein
MIQGILEPALEGFSDEFVKQLEAQGANLGKLASDAPQVLTRPVSYTIYNTRPFDVAVASVVSFVGLIYLLVLAFFITVSDQFNVLSPVLTDQSNAPGR